MIPTPPRSIVTIALATDRNFLPLALTTISSILLYASKRETVRFVVLGDGLTEADGRLLERVVTAFGCRKEQLRLIELGPFLETLDLPLWNGGKTAWLRLLLPELLTDCSHVLYTDVDTLWLCDVEHFRPWLETSHSVAWVPDGYICHAHENSPLFAASKQTILSWHECNGFAFSPKHYPNSGILVMNLEKLRRNGFSETWRTFVRRYTDTPCADQEVIHVLLLDDHEEMPEWTNWLTGCFRPLPGPCVLHLAGRPLPFRKGVGIRKCLLPDDLLLLRDFWLTVMRPLLGEMFDYDWHIPWTRQWTHHHWPRLQARFPILFRWWNRRLITRAKTSEAKRTKLSVREWDVFIRAKGAIIPARRRAAFRAQWQRLLKERPHANI